MNNIPEIKVGIVAVSRDCFPESLSVNRRAALVAAYEKKYGAGAVYECPVCIVESEAQAMQALADVRAAGATLCAYTSATSAPKYPKRCSRRSGANRRAAP